MKCVPQLTLFAFFYYSVFSCPILLGNVFLYQSPDDYVLMSDYIVVGQVVSVEGPKDTLVDDIGGRIKVSACSVNVIQGLKGDLTSGTQVLCCVPTGWLGPATRSKGILFLSDYEKTRISLAKWSMKTPPPVYAQFCAFQYRKMEEKRFVEQLLARQRILERHGVGLSLDCFSETNGTVTCRVGAQMESASTNAISMHIGKLDLLIDKRSAPVSVVGYNRQESECVLKPGTKEQIGIFTLKPEGTNAPVIVRALADVTLGINSNSWDGQLLSGESITPSNGWVPGW